MGDFITSTGNVVRGAADIVTGGPLRRWITGAINLAAVNSGNENYRTAASTLYKIVNAPDIVGAKINAGITSLIPEWTEEKAENPRNTWTIDKTHHLARYYDENGNVLITTTVGTGLIPGDKHVEGDNKSPTGTFKLGPREETKTKKGGTADFGTHYYRLPHKNDNGTPSGVGIHGTGYPWFNGIDVSHGCFRVSNSDIEKFYDIAPNHGAGATLISYEKLGGNIKYFV